MLKMHSRLPGFAMRIWREFGQGGCGADRPQHRWGFPAWRQFGNGKTVKAAESSRQACQQGFGALTWAGRSRGARYRSGAAYLVVGVAILSFSVDRAPPPFAQECLGAQCG